MVVQVLYQFVQSSGRRRKGTSVGRNVGDTYLRRKLDTINGSSRYVSTL